MAESQLVWVCNITHKDGEEHRLFRTEASANKVAAEWAREWWPIECAGAYDMPTQAAFDALSDDDATTLYFDYMAEQGVEFLSIYAQSVED